MLTPSLDWDMFTEDGRRGWMGAWYAHESDESMVPVKVPLKTQYIDETRMFFRCAVGFGVYGRDASAERLQHELSRGADEALDAQGDGIPQAARDGLRI